MKTRILLTSLLAVGLTTYAQQVQITAVEKGNAINVKGSDSTVLILLNGEQITEANMQALATGSIESISILKDATATAVYGKAGKNGVLLIKTKAADGAKLVNGLKVGVQPANDPLYIVDGLKLSKTEMENINPDDITSINVLKGDRGIVLYGADAVNGVIEIVTKSGKK